MAKLSTKKLQEKLERYRILKDKVSEIEEEMKTLKEEFGTHLHEIQENQLDIALSDGETWRLVYQTSERTSTDLKLLMEYVGARKYDEIVSKNEITSLYIKKAPKEKKSSVTNVKPIEDDVKIPNVPKGSILA